MDIEQLIDLARTFARLGSAVQDQLEDVANGEPVEDQNPNAMRMCVQWLQNANRAGVDGASDLAAEIQEALAAQSRS